MALRSPFRLCPHVSNTHLRCFSSVPPPSPAISESQPSLQPSPLPTSAAHPSSIASPQSSRKSHARLAALFNARQSPPTFMTHPSHSTAEASSEEKERGDSQSVGEVTWVQEDIVHVKGLSSAAVGSLVRFDRRDQKTSPVFGLVMNVHSNRVVIALLYEGSSSYPISTGSRVYHESGEVPSFPVGPSLSGRVLSPLGLPLDDLPPLSPSTLHLPSLSPPSPSLIHRSSPTHFLSTGFKHVDFFHPVTRGIRIGLLGDKMTGKTTLAVESLTWIVQQGRKEGRDRVKGVYCMIGKRRQELKKIKERFLQAGVLDDVTIIFSSEGDSQAAQYLAPFSACTVADWWRDEGQHALIVYDDLVTHGAVCQGLDKSLGYSSLSTSYIHAKLLERTASMVGGGSSTALCVLESFRPERAVSVVESLVGFVDHCVYLDAAMVNEGYWPAINCSSIIGRPSARFRSPLTRSITHSMSQAMLQSERTANQYHWAKEFGLEEDDQDQSILTYRDKLQRLLSQGGPMRLEDQLLSVMVGVGGRLVGVDEEEVEGLERELQDWMRVDEKGLYDRLRVLCESEGVQEFDEKLRKELEEAVDRFMTKWRADHGVFVGDDNEE